MPSVPLCDKLVIPQNTRLVCKIPRLLRPQKQALEFPILSQGAEALFKIVVNESQPFCGMSIQDTGGNETIAMLSTEEIWSSPGAENPYPVLSILRPSRALFASVKKAGNGGIFVMQGQTPLLTLSGEFDQPNVKVFAPDGTCVASTAPVSSQEYHLRVEAGADAGVVVLAMLAADKLGLGR